MDVARQHPVPIDRSDGAAWLAATVRAQPDSLAFVYHTVMLQYLDAVSRARLLDAIGDLGATSTKRSPVAWLRFESGPGEMELRLTVYPDGVDRTIATADAPRQWIAWRRHGRDDD